jgi:hypothetical protein
MEIYPPEGNTTNTYSYFDEAQPRRTVDAHVSRLLIHKCDVSHLSQGCSIQPRRPYGLLSTFLPQEYGETP